MEYILQPLRLGLRYVLITLVSVWMLTLGSKQLRLVEDDLSRLFP